MTSQCGMPALAIFLIDMLLSSMVSDGLITQQDKDDDIARLKKGLPSEILK